MEKFTRHEILSWVHEANFVLRKTPAAHWAALWVGLRMTFHRKFSGGVIFTTEHGAEFFQNLEKHLNGFEKYIVNPKDPKGPQDKEYQKWLEGVLTSSKKPS